MPKDRPSSKEPIKITSPKLLMVEGQDDEEFFKALIRHTGLTKDIQIQNFGGVDQLRKTLQAIIITSGFRHFLASEVVSLGIIRDADQSDPINAFRSVCSALRASGLTEPSELEIFEGENPRVGVLILPDKNNPGMLETLCLKSIVNDPVMECIDEYFHCINKLDLEPKNMAKAKVQAFLASRPEYVPHLGLAAQKGYWLWDNPVFDHIKKFLSNL